MPVRSRELNYFRTLLDHAGTLVMVVDAAGCIQRFNRACELLSGFRSADVTGKFPWEILVPAGEESDRWRRKFGTKPSAGIEDSTAWAGRWRSKTGENLLINWTMTTLPAGAGMPDYRVCTGTDITAHETMEQLLLLKDSAIEHALNGMAVAEPDGRITYTNPAFLKLWGYNSSEEVVGRQAQELLESPQQTADALAVLHRDGQWHGTLAGRRLGSERFIVEVMAVQVRDATGKPLHLLASFQDITERQRAEDSVRQNEAWLRQAQAIANIGAWELDPADGKLKLSESACDIVGLDAQSCPSSYQEFLDIVHPDDRDMVEHTFQTTVAKGLPHDITHRIILPDGSLRWLLNRGETLSGANGEKTHRIGALQNITDNVMRETALRESESNYRILTENASIGILVGTPEHAYYANPHLLNMLGYRFDEFVNLGMRQQVHPAELEKVSRYFQARASGQPAPAVYETVFLGHDGRAVPVEITPTRISWKGEHVSLVFIHDISERKRLEREKRNSERWFQGVFNALEEAILVVSPERALLSINPAAVKMFGYSAAEAKRQSTEIFHVDGDHFAEFGHRIREAFSRNESAEFEYVAKRKNGEVFPTEHTVSQLRNDSGEILGLVSVVRDITARKQAEEALRRSEEFLRLVVQATNDGIWDWNPLTHDDYLSPRWKEIFGFRDDELANKDSSFFDLLHPDDRARVQQAVNRHFDHGEPFHIEVRMRHKDGGYRWILSRGEVVRAADGKPLRMVGSISDISERIEALETVRRNEQQLKVLNESLEARVRERTVALADAMEINRQILAASPVGIVVYRDSGECIFANDAIAALTHASVEQLTHQNFFNIESWRATGLIDDALAVLADGNKRIREVHATTSFGTDVRFENCLARFHLSGRPHLLLIVTDTQARYETETALLRAKEDAEQASRAKNEFLSRMSHELRTPLNAILGFTQVLETEPLEVELADYVQEIHHAGDHLLELINELLDLSRIEAGKLVLDIKPVDFAPVLQQAIQFVQASIDRHGITLTNHCPSSLPIVADATRMRQILVNLLSNAVKYNREGGSITIDCEPAAAGLVRIRVTDTGVGITAENMAAVFTPFERLGAEKTAVEGTGIGLALSRQLAGLMGMQLDLTSRPGAGTTFWLEAPLAGDLDPPAPPSPATSAATTAVITILYVEDNAANLRVMEALFRRRPNLRLLSATNGELALDIARQQQPDAILLDIHLPEMDGYAVLARLKSDAATHRIPVLALSADALVADRERGLRAGFDDYLGKPVVFADVLSALRKALLARGVGPR